MADVVRSEELRSFLLRFYSAWGTQDFEPSCEAQKSSLELLAEPGSISIATLHRDYIDLCGPIAFIANIVRRKSR